MLVAAAAIAALPLSLHFEGNDGTAEPFIIVLPCAAVVGAAGAAIALRRRRSVMLLLNLLAVAAMLVYWIFLVTYEGD
jgi:hypothetical protein